MNLCSSGHDEICFEGRQCPFCDKLADLSREIDDKDQKIDSLRDELATERENLESHRQEINQLRGI